MFSQRLHFAIITTLILWNFALYVEACRSVDTEVDDGGLDGDGEPPPYTTPPSYKGSIPSTVPPDYDILRALLGRKIHTFQNDPVGYTYSATGYAYGAHELACDFDGYPCCWSNVNAPVDDLEWRNAIGVPEESMFREKFGPFLASGPAGTPPIPAGKFLYVAGRQEGMKEAMFKSCSIKCAKEVTVRLSHWSTAGPLLRICTRSTKKPTVFHKCQVILSGETPGPSEVTVETPDEPFEIVIVGSDLIHRFGEVIIVDDIVVEYQNSC